MSGDIMSFPDNWWAFVQQYQFADKDEVYTNGSMLIQSFRVRQMVEHYFGGEVGKSKPPCGGGFCPICSATLGNDRVTEDGIDKWMRSFQSEHGELAHIGPDELRELAFALHDDIPLGYEASMRLADWLLHTTLGGGKLEAERDEWKEKAEMYRRQLGGMSAAHARLKKEAKR